MDRRNALQSLSLFVAGVGGFPQQSSRRNPMSTESTFSVTRHTLTTSKSFDELIGEVEKRAPVVPVSKLDELVALRLPQDDLRERVARLIGPSGFMIFLKIRHDSLFSQFGRTRASVQYALGNPLIAKEVTDKAPAICLYAPLRLAVYESPDTRETIVSYDSPASLFSSFSVPEATDVGAMLARKMQDLVNQCL